MFDTEIRKISNEILALKQQKEKMAQVMKTVSTTVTLSFNLELNQSQWGLTTIRSDKMAVVKIDAGSNNSLIGIQYNITGLDSRVIRDVGMYDETDNSIGRMVYVYSQNSRDAATLNGGGSVELTYEMTIISTSEISVSVDYEDLWVN